MSLIDQYSPVLRYFSPSARALAALTSEGITLIRRIDDGDWKVRARKRKSLSYDEWIAIKRKNIAQLPAWARDIQDLQLSKTSRTGCLTVFARHQLATTSNRTAKARTACRPGCGSSV
ncbi:MAG: hypothetical protein ACLP4V_06490 [Methylocella sp.]